MSKKTPIFYMFESGNDIDVPPKLDDDVACQISSYDYDDIRARITEAEYPDNIQLYCKFTSDCQNILNRIFHLLGSPTVKQVGDYLKLTLTKNNLDVFQKNMIERSKMLTELLENQKLNNTLTDTKVNTYIYGFNDSQNEPAIYSFYFENNEIIYDNDDVFMFSDWIYYLNNIFNEKPDTTYTCYISNTDCGYYDID